MDSNNTPLKPEPGPSTGYKRLPSFRTPRDLNLSGFQKAKPSTSGSKKVYLPNLNVQRKKPSEDVANPAQEKSTQKSDEKPKKERTKKKTANYIQSSGVFSEGLAPSIKTGRWTSNRYSESSDTAMIRRPVLNKVKDAVKMDKNAEESLIKELLRDDFIDDPSMLPDMKHCPVQLPLKSFDGVIFKKEADEVKTKMENLSVIPDVKVKEEPGEELPLHDSIPEPKTEVKPRNLSQMRPLTISQLLSQSTERSFIFFQLPHVLPKEKVFVPAGVKGSQPCTPNSQSEPEERNVLKKLPAGKIGKLQILKSGRARLVLGDAKFYIEPGTQPSFKQDVMAIDLNQSTHTGDMINLGSITSHMIVTPDWHQLLSV